MSMPAGNEMFTFQDPVTVLASWLPGERKDKTCLTDCFRAPFIK